jgi:membrane associated rhomboid family serine protease
MSYEQFRPTGFRVLPLVVKNLLIINGLFFLATISFGSVFNLDLTETLGLHYFQSPVFKPYQLVTYMFMHGNFSHILFNMFALWMFGNVLENYWGPKRFLIYYMVTGIGAGLIQLLVIYIQVYHAEMDLNPDQIAQVRETGSQLLQNNPSFDNLIMYKLYGLYNMTTVGASGAVFGLLLAFGMLFPNTLIYIYFFIPMKAKWFVIIYGVIELFSGVYNTGSNVAHFAHLGGMLFGIFMILYWRKHPHHNY